MGLFDKMFGRGASDSEQQQGAQQRFNELKQKYQTVLTTADSERIQFLNLHVQDNKLFIKAVAPSEEAKNKFWDQVKLVNPNADDITADISVDSSRAMGAAAGGGQGPEVRHTMSKVATISRRSANSFTVIQMSTCGSSTRIVTS